MEISQGRVATIHYTLSDDNGQVLDRSTPDTPLSYLHGAGNIVPGLEQALEGKRLGDTLTADVVPEQGYGPRHEQLIQQVPRDAFPTDVDVVPGVQFEARTQQGPVLVTVTAVGPIRSPWTATTRSPGKPCTSRSRWWQCARPPRRN